MDYREQIEGHISSTRCARAYCPDAKDGDSEKAPLRREVVAVRSPAYALQC